jgi:septum formation inhibitor MinC
MSDWIDELPSDETAMKEVKQVVQQWRKLRADMQKAEIVYKTAQSAYEDFVKKEMVQRLRQNGLEALKLEDGTMLQVEQKVKCSLKGRTDADKDRNLADMSKWLEEHGASALVTSILNVMPSQKQKLREMGIAFDEKTSINTNSVKAWILGEMRMNNIRQEDLPACLSWYMWDDISVKEEM